MKKNIIVLTLVLGLVFSGCSFGSSNGNTRSTDTTSTSDSTTTVDTTTSTTTDTSKKIAEPSFGDGQIYLNAISAHDVKLCAKIVDATIKSRCQKEVTPPPAPVVTPTTKK